MANRKRNIQIKFFVTSEEKNLIIKKQQQLGIIDRSAYLRKMAIDGYVIKPDYTVFKNLAYEINKIGVNINQIAKKANEINNIYENDVKELNMRVDEIWQLLKSTLSNQL